MILRDGRQWRVGRCERYLRSGLLLDLESGIWDLKKSSSVAGWAVQYPREAGSLDLFYKEQAPPKTYGSVPVAAGSCLQNWIDPSCHGDAEQ